MNQSDPLEFIEPGSLVRPGPIGKAARLALGTLCLYALWSIILNTGIILNSPLSALESRTTLLFAPLFVFNYVVNIGFSKSWGKRPLTVSLAILGLSAAASAVTSGNANTLIFGAALWPWLVYFYAHLGLSFALSVFISTPGCEMRAIPELFGRMRGIPSKEHHCPVLFLTRIDKWERDLKSR